MGHYFMDIQQITTAGEYLYNDNRRFEQSCISISNNKTVNMNCLYEKVFFTALDLHKCLEQIK